MKLVVIGGSAHSTPNLFANDSLRAVSENLDVVLVGRSNDRLDAVARAIRLIVRPNPINLTVASIDGEVDVSALRGADVVLCQARYGGYEARASDETFPLKYGMCGDEGLGVGGLAAAWRSWPPLRAVLESIRHECPAAWIILMTSPVGVLTRCALTAFPDLRLAGICELPWTTLQDACDAVGVIGLDASSKYAGVNHLGWFWDVRSGERDLVAAYAASRRGSDDFPSGDLIRRLRAIPLKYLRMHYDSRSVFLEQVSAARPRAAVLNDLQHQAFSAFRSGDVTAVSDVLTRRPAPWYKFAISPLIAGLAGAATAMPFFLTARNEGYVADFDAGEVVEIPHRFRGGHLKPAAGIGKVPEPIRGALESFVAYERAASDAVSRRDGVGIQAAVSIHPWVDDASAAALVTAEICR